MAKTTLKLRITDWIRRNKLEFILLTTILLVGAFLRLYRISEYMTFLGDEGRDVIVVRRLLVDFDPILIGPGTSIGNMYLGPLYYYMMAPALFLANFSPVGPAIQIALLGVATIFFVWFIGREWFPTSPRLRGAGPSSVNIGALVAAGLYAISPTVIIYSRSSWNPNIMPFFALMSIYSIWQVWVKREWRWLMVAAISFAFVLQSHYLGLLLAPSMGFYWLVTLYSIRKTKDEKLNFIKNSIAGLVLFALLMSPLVIFDWRHGWRNFTAIHKFFTQRQTTISARPWTAIPKLPEIIPEAASRLVGGTNEGLGIWISGAIIAAGLWAAVFHWKKLRGKKIAAYFLLAVWLGVAFAGLGVYKQEIYDHYYGFFFAAPFLLIGGLVQTLKDHARYIYFLSLIAIFILAFVNLQNNPLKYPPNRQLQRTQEVVQKMIDASRGERFNIAVIAERNYEGAYQYYLERLNALFVIIDPQRADETITEQLFVVCEFADRKKCDPTHNPKAEVANFGWSKIKKHWDVAGVVLYKLVHTQ